MPHSMEGAELGNPDMSVDAQKNVTFSCLPFMTPISKIPRIIAVNVLRNSYIPPPLQASIFSFPTPTPAPIHNVCPTRSWLFQAPCCT